MNKKKGMKCEILCQTKKNGLKYLTHKGLTYLKVFLTKRRHWSSSALVFFLVDSPTEEKIVT